MKNFIKVCITVFLIIFSLSACETNNSELESSKISNEKISIKITELNNEIITLQEQVNSLIERVNKPEIVIPINYDNKLLYVNSLMPLVISLPSDNDLPIKVYKNADTISIYFENEDVVQFIEGYSKVPSIIVKENNTIPEYYDRNVIIKVLDENWVIIKNISIENSLDEQTHQRIEIFLENIKFY